MDSRGVTGPFEDLPSLLIVIVATGLFISVAARGVVMQTEAAGYAEREERAWRLLRAALDSKLLASSEGVVDLREARMTESEDIAAEMGWLDGGWLLRIAWEDGTLEWSSGVPTGERAVAQSSVVVDAGYGLPGRMTAVVWDA